MRIIAHRTIVDFWKKHADAKIPLENWYKTTKQTTWKNFNDLKQTFNSADYAGNQRYVFNIKGNNYRIIAKILFIQQIVYIRFVGTHQEYNQINCETI